MCCFFRNIILMKSTHLQFPGQQPCLSNLQGCVEELEISTETYRSKGKSEHGSNVGRGRARRGIPLNGKCNQCLLANFDSGGFKITLDVSPDGDHLLSHILQIKKLRVHLTLNINYACTCGPRKIEQVEF